MRKVITICLAALLLIPLLAGCSTESKPEPVSRDENGNGSSADVSGAAEIGFGFDLFREVEAEEGENNVLISPVSAQIALAMTYNGARGDTRDAMARVLGYQGMSLEGVNAENAALIEALQSTDTGVTLEIANSLWGDKGIDFNEDFIQRNRDYYDAEVRQVDFGAGVQEALKAINDWVNDNTKGKIKRILDKVEPDTILVLLNAVYFKGTWKSEFDESRTKDEDFTTIDGSSKKVPMMHQEGEYDYLENETFQAVELPYGEDESTGMYIFLPRQDKGLAEFYEGLSDENWEGWISGFRETEGDVALPRFDVECSKVLNEPLVNLGMGPAFEGGLEDMLAENPTGEKVFISRVIQKTFMEVNEEGTEAAAVTGVEVGVTSAQPQPDRFSMVVDRPFFLAIRDNDSGALLFMGSIVDP